jgi:nucleotide-binding universal stress UspA family protein
MKILLAVDGSKSSLKAVDHLVEHASWFREAPAIELLTVHLPVPKLPNINKVISKAQIEKFYQEDGEAALAMRRRSSTSRKLGGLLLGSTATKLLHLSTLPVLLVK